MRYLATKTVQAIDEVIRADQGATYRAWLGRVMPHIRDAYRSDEETHRGHLGASVLGNDCARAVWYGFRWASKSEFEGRMVRLFNRGHIEEARFIAMLLSIGVKVFQQTPDGRQYSISYADGHGGGSGDGVGQNIPDLQPYTFALLEFKTHNNKSFSALKENGVKESKPQHFVQANIYMRRMSLGVCLYMGVNKDTDELYGELLPLDAETADRYIDRGTQIVWAKNAPRKINNSPGYWKCRFCNFRPVCHLDAIPDRNCRTCAYSEPVRGGQWQCNQHRIIIDKKLQLTGCPQYVRHHDI